MKIQKTLFVLSLLLRLTQEKQSKVRKVKNLSVREKFKFLLSCEQRAKVMGKSEVANIFKKGKDSIRRQHGKKRT